MTINCKGQLIDLSSPKIMGILNITPDSFYDGGKYKDERSIVDQVTKMLNEGATFVDVGAYSSRPGAKDISPDEELRRIEPIIKLLVDEFPGILISVDTFRSEVARASIALGAAMINDISASSLDNNMMNTVASLKVPYIMMHMQGNPQTMQQQTTYNDLLIDIIQYFSQKIAQARALQIQDLIIDPGFGFAKTLEQNFSMLNNLQTLKTLDYPILVGLSRKSMIYKTLKNTPDHALNGTTVLNTIALQKGAKILRVHDVKEAYECISLFKALNKS